MSQANAQNPDAVWQQSGESAKLELSGLRAAAALNAPQTGLFDLALLGTHLRGNVLGVERSEAGAPWGALVEHYERGTDLVATYEQTEACPFRATVYWRAHGGIAQQGGAVVDLILSVQTDSLDAIPQIRSRTCFSDAEIVLFAPAAGEHRLDLEHAIRLTDATPNEPIGCVMLRITDVPATYCEMIHPADWRALDIEAQGEQIELGWSLVGHAMEKGVIRRLRVRGIFLNGRAKEQHVSDLYADFAGSPPPLTT